MFAQSAAIEPLDWQTRWDQYVQRTYNWKRVGLVAAGTGFEDTFRLSACGRPPYCFPHHLGGALARRTARTTMEFGASGLLKEDLRRQPSGLVGIHKRIVFAMTHAMLARGPDGDWRPAYSRFAGTVGGVAVCAAWDGRPLTAGRMMRGFGLTLPDYFGDALFTEFGPDLRVLGMKVLNRVRRR